MKNNLPPARKATPTMADMPEAVFDEIQFRNDTAALTRRCAHWLNTNGYPTTPTTVSLYDLADERVFTNPARR